MKHYACILMALLLSMAAFEAAPVLSFAKAGDNLSLTWPATNCGAGFGLEYTDDLSSPNWIKVKADVTNDLCVVTRPATNAARFYRLVSPWGTNLPPFLPYDHILAGYEESPGYFQKNGDPITGVIPASNPLTMYCNYDASPGGWLNAAAVIDPSSPTNGSLSFHWTIRSDQVGEDLHPPRIRGLDSFFLEMQQDALPADTDFEFHLFVTSNTSHLTSEFVSLMSVGSSSLSIQLASECFPCGCTNGECAVTRALFPW